MKKTIIILILCLVAAAGSGIYFATNSFSKHYLDTVHGSDITAACETTQMVHKVTIRNGIVSPKNTTAKLCDTLTITNYDNQVRLVAFGTHDNHQAYDGVTERVLDENQSLTVTLNIAGNFKFHDHLDDTVQGTFSVK